MCGLIGCVSRTTGGGFNSVADQVLTGLKRIQYRGYDSFGFAYVEENGSSKKRLEIQRSTELIESCDAAPDAEVMLGHTRWATHGRVSLENCHPHMSPAGTFALVHNGIVENFQSLKHSLNGVDFVSETDTEVIVALLERSLDSNRSSDTGLSHGCCKDRLTKQRLQAVKDTMALLNGRNTIAALFDDGEIIAFRQGSPLVLGMNPTEYFLASDALCFAPWANQCFVLADGACVSIKPGRVYLENETGEQLPAKWKSSDLEAESLSMEGYDHFMLKEVMQQWRTIGCQALVETDANRVSAALGAMRHAETVIVTGAGGAYYTAIQIAWLLRAVAGIRAIAVQAYEIGTVNCLVSAGDVVIGVSQSGETADTLHAVRAAKSWGLTVISTINMPMSTLEQESDFAFLNQVGAEVCVLSTKSASAQIAFGYLLAHEIAGSGEEARRGLDSVGSQLTMYLTDETRRAVRAVAVGLSEQQHTFLLGRDENVGSALIGALNIKEATYLHAEAFAAGELKHGVIALIEERTPVLVIVPKGDDYMINVAAEVKARGAHVIGIAAEQNPLFDEFIQLPVTPVVHAGYCDSALGQKALSAVTSIIPCQLLAYELAILKGINPDRPRNLAKSVTVQ